MTNCVHAPARSFAGIRFVAGNYFVGSLGSKMGLDATNKWPGETTREWGKPLTMSLDVTARVEEVWRTLDL